VKVKIDKDPLFYKDANGKKPLEKDLLALDPHEAVKVNARIEEIIKGVGWLLPHHPHTENLKKTNNKAKGLYALRVKINGQYHHIPYFIYNGKVYLMFIDEGHDKDNHVPDNDIAKAINMKADFMRRKKK
jgi:hypothetical protein